MPTRAEYESVIEHLRVIFRCAQAHAEAVEKPILDRQEEIDYHFELISAKVFLIIVVQSILSGKKDPGEAVSKLIDGLDRLLPECYTTDAEDSTLIQQLSDIVQSNSPAPDGDYRELETIDGDDDSWFSLERLCTTVKRGLLDLFRQDWQRRRAWARGFQQRTRDMIADPTRSILTLDEGVTDVDYPLLQKRGKYLEHLRQYLSGNSMPEDDISNGCRASLRSLLDEIQAYCQGVILGGEKYLAGDINPQLHDAQTDKRRDKLLSTITELHTTLTDYLSLRTDEGIVSSAVAQRVTFCGEDLGAFSKEIESICEELERITTTLEKTLGGAIEALMNSSKEVDLDGLTDAIDAILTAVEAVKVPDQEGNWTEIPSTDAPAVQLPVVRTVKAYLSHCISNPNGPAEIRLNLFDQCCEATRSLASDTISKSASPTSFQAAINSLMASIQSYMAHVPMLSQLIAIGNPSTPGIGLVGLQLEQSRVSGAAQLLGRSSKVIERAIQQIGEQKYTATTSLESEVHAYREITTPRAFHHLLNNLKKTFICPVCRDTMADSCLRNCGHISCRSCFRSVYDTRSRKCPICQRGFVMDDVINFAVIRR
ncbi:E3 ubiquitin protein ligase [Giardia muris]|uniref:E3 ubiquitin protein ligase n=1 Tax=Giardia muris TaxID=5742 RepID=A0A4Z1SX86_GIAMU|nr:E3 ubiquitin protein ligase [Giardia muris]|eukprot:TNJ30402.1 E3 ubiquitin protein ligase [Giardia muris]